MHNQLQANREVASDILFLYMQALQHDKNSNEMTGIQQISTDSPNIPILNRRSNEEEKETANALAASIAAKLPFVTQKYPDWQIYMKDVKGNIIEFNNPNFSFKANEVSDIIFNIPSDESSRTIIHFSGKQVSADSGNNVGFKAIFLVLTALDLKVEAFYPTVHQGTLLSATEFLRNTQNNDAEALKITVNVQQEHSQFRPE